MKDTLSCNQEKLETLPTKYNNTKESLKGAKSEHAKAKDRVAKLEKSVADLKKVAKEMLYSLPSLKSTLVRQWMLWLET